MNPTDGPSAGRRPFFFLFLVFCFLLQSFFVYFDIPDQDRQRVKLSPEARAGLALWRKHNCQVCHQIYGFGGFLGPDLTNVMARRPNEDWSDILTRGSKQMPAFEFSSEDQGRVIAFLTEVSRTGTGVPSFTTLRETMNPDRLVAEYAGKTGTQVPAPVLHGEELVRRLGCKSCHWMFREGVNRAPDLSTSTALRSSDYISEILRKGLGNMPEIPNLTDQDVADILAYLQWIGQNRQQLGLFCSELENGDRFSWTTVPWFEY